MHQQRHIAEQDVTLITSGQATGDRMTDECLRPGMRRGRSTYRSEVNHSLFLRTILPLVMRPCRNQRHEYSSYHPRASSPACKRWNEQSYDHSFHSSRAHFKSRWLKTKWKCDSISLSLVYVPNHMAMAKVQGRNNLSKKFSCFFRR